MSLAQRIRDYMASVGNAPKFPREIVAGVRAAEAAAGLEPTEKRRIEFGLATMFKEGRMARIDGAASFRYYVARQPKPAITREEAEARKRERDRNRKRRYRQYGAKRWAEHVAELAAQRQRRQERIAEERRKRREDRALRRAQAAVQRMKDAEARKAQPKPRPTSQQPTLAVFAPAPKPAKVEVRAETIDEWMARTGKRPEVLPPCTWSVPIHRIEPGLTERSAA